MKSALDYLGERYDSSKVEKREWNVFPALRDNFYREAVKLVFISCERRKLARGFLSAFVLGATFHKLVISHYSCVIEKTMKVLRVH